MTILHDLEDICVVYGVDKRREHHKIMKEYVKLYHETRGEYPSIRKPKTLHILTLGKLHIYLQDLYGMPGGRV
jgi:hypothetical protein